MNYLMLKRFTTACFSILMLFCVLVAVPCFALPRDVEMVIGETEEFTAPTYAAFTYQWSIESGSGVISIQSGTTSATCKIKAEKVGNAVLHVVYTRSNPLTRSYTNTYKITVSKPSYKVTLDANGGAVYPSIFTIKDGETINLPTPTRSGYSFMGWFTKVDGGNEIHSGNPVTISGDAKLFAHWKAYPSYKVTLDANGGSVYPSSITIKDGDTINLPTPVRSGYSFAGWFTKVDGGNEIHSGNPVTISGDAKLFAHWKAYLSNNDTQDFEYSVLEDGTAEITQYSGKAERLDIPREINGIEVRQIGGGAFYSCTSLTSITIPDSVTTIGDSAFSDCYSLTSVTIPDSVTTIGHIAFSECWSLTSVTIPDSVRDLGINPFAYCNKLKTISVSPDHPTLVTIGGVLFSKADKRLVCYPCALSAAEYLIPQGIEVLGENAFSGCSNLTCVTIPDSVTTIGDGAFHGCSRLTSIVIPDSVTTIGGHAFYGCSRLTGIVIPDSVTTIGKTAFTNCTSLTSIIIPNGVTTIGLGAFFDCYNLTSIVIPDSVTTIGKWAFNGCTSLTSIVIPDSVTTIDNEAFYGCSNLTLIVPRDSYVLDYAEENDIPYTYSTTEVYEIPNPTSQPAQGSTTYCPECGQQIAVTSKFCMYCGFKIPSVSTPASKTPQPTKTPAPVTKTWSSWSSWSTTPAYESSTREVETRTTVTGYNMFHYRTQYKDAPYPRVFRDYSINGDYDWKYSRRSYGEKYMEKYVTADQLAAATTYYTDSRNVYNGKHPGYQDGSTIAYGFKDDEFMWFIRSKDTVTEYRYRDLK